MLAAALEVSRVITGGRIASDARMWAAGRPDGPPDGPVWL